MGLPDLDNQVLRAWVSDQYLQEDTVRSLREAVLARPIIHYLTLENFFKEAKFQELISHHSTIKFSEEQDRRAADGAWLPYDGAVCFARQGVHYGSELFFEPTWHQYCAYLTGTLVNTPTPTEVKLRYHRPNADGFWIHSDSGRRQMVVICYFNKEWRVEDGGLLQLWLDDEPVHKNAYQVDVSPTGRMDLLRNQIIRTSIPGGGFPDGKPHDLVLVDQVVPAYNRVFFCDFQFSRAYHSVTPSGSKERLGFVQWLLN